MTQTIEKMLPCFGEAPVCVIGTLNLALQGIDIVPHDIDLLTTDQGGAKFAAKYGAPIPCLSLGQELAFYKAASRLKDQPKIKLLEQALNC